MIAHHNASAALTRGPIGVLLVNTGTPDSPDPAAVGRYLTQFLSDPRVVDIHPVLRWLLVNVLIVPRRRVTSGDAYRAIWTPEGSPLWVNSKALQHSLGQVLGTSPSSSTPCAPWPGSEEAPPYSVIVAMRYGNPSIANGLTQLMQQQVREIVVVPLFPQYASAATGSVVEEVYRILGDLWNTPPVRVIGPFFDHPDFVGAVVDRLRAAQNTFQPDHILFSYHGLPERHIHKSGCQNPTRSSCDNTGTCSQSQSPCCDMQQPCPAVDVARNNTYCYRAQCYDTTRHIAAQLNLAPTDYTAAFQSRLGRTPWIKPYTDHVMPDLAARGRKRLAVVCPSFVADCLETVEEIGIRAAEAWRAMGGDALHLVPCVNAHPQWVHGLAQLIRGHHHDHGEPLPPKGLALPINQHHAITA